MNEPEAAKEAVSVTTASGLETAVAAIRRSPLVGLDTEFVGEATYEPQLCLLQVSTEDQIFVIDPLGSLQLSDFWQALTEPGREVIALAARQELLFCLRYAGRVPDVVFDPQVAAGLVGLYFPLSHSNLVHQLLNVRVQGGEAYTDWRKRPLSPQQLAYAADDVRYLHALRRVLLEKAESLGRVEWMRSECRRLVDRLLSREQEERWYRGAGASSLSRRELGVLRQLWTWRENTARTTDLPPRRIMGDDLMVAIARRSPRDAAGLFALRGMDRSNLRREAADILAAVQTGQQLAESELPASLRRDDPPQVGILAQLASILSNSLAAQHQVDAGMLATSADLQEFVRWKLGISTEGEPLLIQGWRGEILGHALVELLEGRRSVRVADAKSASPLRIEPVERD